MRSTLMMLAALACVPLARAGDNGYRTPAQPVQAVGYAPSAQGCGAGCAAPSGITTPAACSSGCGTVKCWSLGFGLFSRRPAACGACAAPACAPCATPTPECAPCAPCKPCRRSSHGFARLRAWLCYRDNGECPKGCACTNHCHAPLYLYFLKDCAYRPSHCCGGQGGMADGAVNPPYAKSVFHGAPMSVYYPTGVGVPHH